MEEFTVKKQKVPAVGLGTWQLEDKECIKCVEHALELGYRHIDTAQIYENEKEIGTAIKNSAVKREDIFLVDKISTSNFNYEDALKSTDESLEKLQTDYVDLLLMHWPNNSVPLEETLEAMNEIKDSGKAKHLGLSNFPPSLVDKASEHIDIFCNQIEFHPYLEQNALIRQSKKMKYMVTAYCPIAKGRVLKDGNIQEISDKYEKSPVQITLRWLYQQNVASIPKSADFDHMKENLEIFDFELNREDMKIIDSLEMDLHLDPVSYLAKD